MNVRDLDGNTSYWQIVGHINNNKNKSQYHLLARDILRQKYPTMKILEEVPIKVSKSQTMYLDFYIPMIRTAIEVHGEQHYSFTPHYHGSRLDFLKAQKRDKNKREWCETNNIKYIEFPFNKKEHWENILANN